MIKIISPWAYDFHEPQTRLVKMGSRGLRGNDLQDFLKIASHTLVDRLNEIKLLPGDVPTFDIALGSTEGYGPNRNGDGFKAAVCRAYHPTFVKFAYSFRNHQNRDPKKSYGRVKASAFNEDMQRVELITVLNGTKEAAERNGGLVADEELEALARGEDVPRSMSCRVSHDICSGCGNKARSRAEYCDGPLCKYGGLRHNIARTFADGHTAHADNPDPAWFDQSKVYRGADRISFNLGILNKAANDQLQKCGAEMAEELQLTTPSWLLEEVANPWATPATHAQLKSAASLIAAEERAWCAPPAPVAVAFSSALLAPVAPINCSNAYKMASIITAAHQTNCYLPLSHFLDLVTCGYGKSGQLSAEIVSKVAAHVPGVISRMAMKPDFEQRLADNPYLSKAAADEDLWLLKRNQQAWSLDRDRVVERLQLSVVRDVKPRTIDKLASSQSAEKLAEEYGLYTLAFLSSQPNDHLPDLTALVVQANRVF